MENKKLTTTNKQKVLIASTLAGLAIMLGVYGASKAGAFEGTGMNSLASAIASKFNLDQKDVQAVFDEHRNQMMKQHQQDYKVWLDQEVQAGKLTQDQEKLILEKRTALEAERAANRSAHQNLSAEERKALMDSRHAELEKWADENGIDLQYLLGFGRGMGRIGDHHGRGFEQ